MDRACRLAVFGGTQEGRILAEFCAARGIPAWVSVVSGYGRSLLPDAPGIFVRRGAMEQDEMRVFLRENGIRLCVDATHPYARRASENIFHACETEGVRYLRCTREEDGRAAGRVFSGGVHMAADVKEAAVFLETVQGGVLVTTGSRELAAFTVMKDYRERIFARVLPDSGVIRECEAIGVRGKHLIAMQGPFSQEMNEAMIRQTGVSWLVTKESGRAGGFEEKLAAAAACGIGAVVIKRSRETGLSVEAARREILACAQEGEEAEGDCAKGAGRAGDACGEYSGGMGIKGADHTQEVSGCAKPVSANDGEEEKNADSRDIVLAGIGMGPAGQMTLEVWEALRKCDAVLGAERMLKAAEAAFCKFHAHEKQPERIAAYMEDDIAKELKAHPEWKRIVILFSGDSGFYSGASRVSARLEEEGMAFCILPGIASISFFAARMKKSWQNVPVYTAHGRSLDVRAMLARGESEMFVLTGGENGAGRFCRELTEAGGGDILVTAGENLAYPEERIRSGRAGEMAEESFSPLCLLYLERPGEETVL